MVPDSLIHGPLAKFHSSRMATKTFLSGIQPSGRPHLGNYFGAIRQHIALQEQPGERFFFIADYHALTTSREPEQLREAVRDVAVTYLSLGLDPERSVLFRQSDIKEVTELSWLLSCVTGMGLLERAHSYKDKTAKGIAASVGLFTYPVLMAADILAYDSDLVPVGKDQVQHVEMTQDMAASFNALYGPVFKRPECLLEKTVGRIVTDSRAPEEPKNPDDLLLFRFLELFLAPSELALWKERVQRGGEGAPGYGHLKAALIEGMENHFAAARVRREELLADPAEVDRILERGAERARARAVAVRDRALRACGLR